MSKHKSSSNDDDEYFAAGVEALDLYGDPNKKMTHGAGGVWKNLNTRVEPGAQVQFGHTNLNVSMPDRKAKLESAMRNQRNPLNPDVKGKSQIKNNLPSKNLPSTQLRFLKPSEWSAPKSERNSHFGVRNFVLGPKVSSGQQLLMSCEAGNKQLVDSLLKFTNDVDQLHGQYGTPLQTSILFNHPEIAELLLSRGAKANAKNEVNVKEFMGIFFKISTALELAVLLRDVGWVSLLLKHGADPNTKCAGVGNVLMAAALYNDLHIALALVNKGAFIQGTGQALSPIQAAALHGQLDMVTAFLDKYPAEINVVSTPGFGTCLQAAVYGRQMSVVQYLLRKGAKDAFDCGIFGSAVQAAGYIGDIKSVKMLAKAGRPIEISFMGLFPNALYAAARNGHLELVKYFTEEEAGFQRKLSTFCARSGRTPLHEAALCGSVEVVAYLLQKDFSANSYDTEKQETPLTCAISADSPQCVLLLFENGAVVDDESRALKAAASCSNTNIAEYLLLKDASPSKGVLEVAIRCKNYPMAKLLLEKGAPANAQTASGSLLNSAIKAEDSRFLELLLQNGANPNKTFEPGDKSPLLHAVARGQTAMAKILLNSGATAAKATFSTRDSPLFEAVKSEDAEIVGILLQNGAKSHAQERPVLEKAVYSGNVKIISALLERNKAAKARLKSMYMPTGNALRWAANQKRPALVEALIKAAEWKPDLQDLEVAIRVKNGKILSLMLDNGAPKDGKPSQRPLDLAVTSRFHEGIQILLEHRAEVNYAGNSLDRRSSKPLVMAIKQRDKRSVELLLQGGADLDESKLFRADMAWLEQNFS